MFQRLLIIGFISFAIALVDSINVNATGFSDLHWWGKLFCTIVCAIIVSWIVIVVAKTIRK